MLYFLAFCRGCNWNFLNKYITLSKSLVRFAFDYIKLRRVCSTFIEYNSSFFRKKPCFLLFLFFFLFRKGIIFPWRKHALYVSKGILAYFFSSKFLFKNRFTRFRHARNTHRLKISSLTDFNDFILHIIPVNI